jgi:hypothetical protein
VLHEDGQGGVRGERHPAREHLVGHDPEGVDVGPAVDLAHGRLLGSHVLRGAGDHAGDGDPARALDDLGDPEVHEVHPAPLVEQDVLRLHVAMDDPLVVGVVEGVRHPAEDGHRAREGDALALQELGKAAALDEPHGHPGDALLLLDVEAVDGDDVRVLEAGDDLGLVTEALGEGRVVQELAGEDLQGDVAVEGGLVGLVDRGHAAPAERLDDAVRSGRGAGRQGHGRSPLPIRPASAEDRRTAA